MMVKIEQVNIIMGSLMMVNRKDAGFHDGYSPRLNSLMVNDG